MQSAEPAYFHDADSPMPVQRLMETMAQLLEHCSGELAAHTSSFEEIESENTALRQALSAAEVALTQVFEMREAVLHNLPLGLSMFDTEQRLTTCNQRFCDLFHFSEEDRKPGT